MIAITDDLYWKLQEAPATTRTTANVEYQRVTAAAWLAAFLTSQAQAVQG